MASLMFTFHQSTEPVKPRSQGLSVTPAPANTKPADHVSAFSDFRSRLPTCWSQALAKPAAANGVVPWSPA